MGAIYPHVYFVTLDTSLKDRLKYQNSTAITAVEAFKKELDRVSTKPAKRCQDLKAEKFQKNNPGERAQQSRPS